MLRLPTAAACLVLTAGATAALAFPGGTVQAPDCATCHKLTLDEVRGLLAPLVDGVLAVRPSRVPGFWDVDVQKQGRKIPVSLDVGLRYLVTGEVIDIRTMESLTRDRMIDLNRVDASLIPLDDAIVIGDPNAPVKIVVFDDPECPFCQKLHPEMKAAAAQRPEVAFFIKMLPLKMHPDAARKSRAIICAKSAQMLEDSLAGKPIPDPTCETDQVEKNEALAQRLGIGSTPTLVYPDGRVVPGYRTADKILALVGERESQSAGKAQK